MFPNLAPDALGAVYRGFAGNFETAVEMLSEEESLGLVRLLCVPSRALRRTRREAKESSGGGELHPASKEAKERF